MKEIDDEIQDRLEYVGMFVQEKEEDNCTYIEDDDVKPIYQSASDIYDDILKYCPDIEILLCYDDNDFHLLKIERGNIIYEIINYGGYPDIDHILIENNEEVGWGWTANIEIFCERRLWCE